MVPYDWRVVLLPFDRVFGVGQDKLIDLKTDLGCQAYKWKAMRNHDDAVGSNCQYLHHGWREDTGSLKHPTAHASSGPRTLQAGFTKSDHYVRSEA